MPRQVVVIHGGETFATYEQYVAFLRGCTVDDPSVPSPKGWKDTLAERLGDDFAIVKPSMPNKLNAKYAEWRIWFEKYVPYLHDDVTLVGHSLGGIFLAQYLSERDFPKHIRQTALVAPPAGATGPEDSLADFALPEDMSRFAERGGKITLFFSQDDFCIPFAHKEVYATRLPSAKIVTFTDRGHFLQEEFPELVALIRGE